MVARAPQVSMCSWVFVVRMCSWARPTSVGTKLASGGLATRCTEARFRLTEGLSPSLSQPPPPPPARAGEPTPEEIPDKFLRSARIIHPGELPLSVEDEISWRCTVICKDVEKRRYTVLLLPVVDSYRSQEALVASAPFDGDDGLGEELNLGFKFDTDGHGRGRDGACGRAEGRWR